MTRRANGCAKSVRSRTCVFGCVQTPIISDDVRDAVEQLYKEQPRKPVDGRVTQAFFERLTDVERAVYQRYADIREEERSRASQIAPEVGKALCKLHEDLSGFPPRNNRLFSSEFEAVKGLYWALDDVAANTREIRRNADPGNAVAVGPEVS